MRLPFALAALDWIAPRDVQGARLAIDLDGHRGWTCPAAGGYCVATEVQWPDGHASPAQPLSAAFDDRQPADAALSRWLTRVSLALAGQAELRDDNLYVANDVLWWVHRFDGDESAARVEAQLRRQLLACAMVASQTDGTPGASPPSATFSASAPPLAPGTDAHAIGAAGAARRLRAMQRC